MLKKHMAACLVMTAFVAAPAFAQTSPGQSGATDRPAAAGSGSTTTGSPAMQPGATGSSTMNPSTMGSGSSSMSSSATTQGGAMQGQFLTQMQQGQMKASDLIGTRVISSNNESIGDINDVIVDRNGQIVAAVVGVGGFLGIGEKDVAVPFETLEFATGQQAAAAGNNAPATTGSTAPGSATTGVSGGTSGAAGGTAGSSASADNDRPERVILRMTKAELQAAPSFDADGNNRSNNTSTGSTGVSGQPGSGGASGVTPAPKQ